MNINWLVLGIISVAVIILIVFLVVRNLKDKKELTDLLNTDTDIQNSYPNDINDD